MPRRCGAGRVREPHQEPREAGSSFERGAYVYFDHDSGWCQRIKADFAFEYQYLEEDPAATEQ